MTQRLLTREQSRAVDALAIEKYGVPSMVLMENAGRGVADTLLQIAPELVENKSRLAIFCGRGNNGGDGFVVARHLLIRGANPLVLLLASPNQLEGDARTNYEILRHTKVPIKVLSAEPKLSEALDEAVEEASWLIDAMLGTGAQGEPREPVRTAIEWLNNQAAQRLAVDVPSGLDCDSGEPAQVTFRADHTCTFVTSKVGFASEAAAPFLGECHTVSIGIPTSWIDDLPQ